MPMFLYSAAPVFKPVAMIIRILDRMVLSESESQNDNRRELIYMTANFAEALQGALRTVASIS